MASTNTKDDSSRIQSALSGIPSQFRSHIIGSYESLKAAFAEAKFDLCGLRAGKFAEAMLRYLQHSLTGKFIPFGKKIPNYVGDCRALEQLPQDSGPESFRVVMPRALSFLYTLRNKRGIGHIGGDVDANEIDAATSARVADWCLCETIRVVHTLSLEEAQDILNTVAVRQIPRVWQVVGKKRVLDPSMDYQSQTLLLLYSDTATGIPLEDLYNWTGHSNLTVYRRDVVAPLHKKRLIEYDRDTEMIILSPSGSKRVEQTILHQDDTDGSGKSIS
jgi:hypothetical protein